ncbi:MAG: cysteine-rich CWC family protein [Polaromonas sp.]|nr:cysteine-rich CWC family protein [Polaromonas sp.]
MDAANSSLCPRCGAGLRCGMVTDEAQCWCFSMPRVIPVPPADSAEKASCLCPNCLQHLIELQAASHDPHPAND